MDGNHIYAKLLPGKILALDAEALALQFEAALARPMELQRLVLVDILQKAAHTEWGRRYDFAQINSPQKYISQVPLSTWQDYAPYGKRLECGEKDLLFPGPAHAFLHTSATSGAAKLVPQSAAGLEVNKAVTNLRSHYRRLAVDAGSLSNGGVFLLSSSPALGHTPGGVPVGFSSGLTAAASPGGLQAMRCCPPWVYGLENPELRDFLLLRFALARPDVVAVMGNSPRRFLALLGFAKNWAPQLIAAIRGGDMGCPSAPLSKGGAADVPPPNAARAEALAELLAKGLFWPKYLWPALNLVCFWLAGPMAPAVEALRPLLPPDAQFFDAGYGASEGKIGLPIKAEAPYAPPALFSGFFEFLPQAGGPPVCIDQLQEGGIYEPVLTTYSGLYRYRLGDLVRVQGREGATPCFAFWARRGDTVNLAGEKLGGGVLWEAARRTSAALGLPFLGFALWPNTQTGCYQCYYELHPGHPPHSAWATQFDTTLQKLAPVYARRRAEGSLGPPLAEGVPQGCLDTANPGAGGQQKPCVVLRQPLLFGQT